MASSWQQTRDEIATALSSVAGVTGHPTRPTSPKPGDAWPLLAAITHGPAGAWSASWRVLLILGPLELDAIDQLDALGVPLLDLLSAVSWVDDAEPVTVVTDAGPLQALEIRTRSE